jgi:hypothetical protein
MKRLFVAFFFLIIVQACDKEPAFSPVPEIKLIDFTQISNSNQKDSIGILKIGFTDGDGDMGLSPYDTLPPYQVQGDFYYNFVVKYFEKQQGIWVEVTTLPDGNPLINSARIPNITPTGQRKALEGEISINLFTNNPLSSFDTIRYACFIYDRALNKSNIIETNEIVIKK